MKAVKVQYTVKEEYVETNKRNIRKVMAELRKLNDPGIKYSAFVLDDGKSFVHFVMQTDGGATAIGDLDSFKSFRQQLQESQPEVPPKAENLSLAGSSFDIF